MTAALPTTAALILLSPANYQGETSSTSLEFTVSEYTEQPVQLDLSHIFPVSAIAGVFFVTEGPEDVDYSVVISSASGKEVFARNASFDIPSELMLRTGDSTFTMADVQDIDMSAGKYMMTLTSTHPINYRITQENKLLGAIQIFIFLDILSVVAVIITVRTISQKRRAIRMAQFMSAYSQPSYPPQCLGYHSGGVPVPSYPAYSVPYQPPPQAIVEDEYDTGYICAKCGNAIMNPVVQDVITCEKCGEKEYIGGR